MASSAKRLRLAALVTRRRQFTRSSSASEYQTSVQGISASCCIGHGDLAPLVLRGVPRRLAGWLPAGDSSLRRARAISAAAEPFANAAEQSREELELAANRRRDTRRWRGAGSSGASAGPGGSRGNRTRARIRPRRRCAEDAATMRPMRSARLGSSIENTPLRRTRYGKDSVSRSCAIPMESARCSGSMRREQAAAGVAIHAARPVRTRSTWRCDCRRR